MTASGVKGQIRAQPDDPGRMRARIHRGAHEIGGSCVELEAGGKRLVIDLGRPLDAGWGEDVALPEIEGLIKASDSLLGVVISHAHPDHYGLLDQLPDPVPIFIGAASEAILKEAAFFGPGFAIPDVAGHLVHKEPMQLGPFRVTPLLADHSAFDAYSLVIEAGGRRLLYSGDLRAHGRKPRAFSRLLSDPPGHVHAMLLEGTRLSRPQASDDDDDEQAVERRMLEFMRETRGLVLALYSPQNVDRYVGMYRAALQAGRDLVIDLYTAGVAEATGCFQTIPQATWDRVRVYVPQAQRVRVKNTGEFSRVDRVRAKRLFAEDLIAQPERYVLTFRASMIPEVERLGAQALDGAGAIWSMWPGYLNRESSSALRTFLDRAQIPLAIAHASGHARVKDLRRLAEAVAPDRVVPIHTAAPHAYSQIYERIEAHPDGEWWDV